MQSGLVLKRKANEQIVIGGDIVITVLEFIGGSIVKLHIDAPRDIAVHRMEVWDRIQQAKDEADRLDGTPRRES